MPSGLGHLQAALGTCSGSCLVPCASCDVGLGHLVERLEALVEPPRALPLRPWLHTEQPWALAKWPLARALATAQCLRVPFLAAWGCCQVVLGRTSSTCTRRTRHQAVAGQAPRAPGSSREPCVAQTHYFAGTSTYSCSMQPSVRSSWLAAGHKRTTRGAGERGKGGRRGSDGVVSGDKV